MNQMLPTRTVSLARHYYICDPCKGGYSGSGHCEWTDVKAEDDTESYCPSCSAKHEPDSSYLIEDEGEDE